MGRGLVGMFPSLKICPVRSGILRNAGSGSRNFSILKLYRKGKPFVRVGRKATGLKGQVGFTGLPRIIWFINFRNKQKEALNKEGR